VAIVDVSSGYTELFTQHAQRTTAVRLSPDTERVASGDASGVVRVWERRTRTLVNSMPALSASVLDISWSPDGTKLACVGEGRGKLARCFNVEGNAGNHGDFEGLARPTNCCALTTTPAGKLGLLTGSDDGGLRLYEGLPFRFSRSFGEDRAFVNSLRVAPSMSNLFAVAGAQLKLYELESGTATTLVGHSGSVLCATFAPDSLTLASAGVDKTVRIFDMATNSQIHTFTLGSELADMQCGTVFLNASTVASVSLSGDVHLFDTRARTWQRTLRGHQRSVTALACSPDGTVWTADYEGKTLAHNVESHEVERVTAVHTNAVVGLAASAGDRVAAGLDDALSWSGSDVVRTPLPGAPTSLSISLDGLAVVATAKGIILARKGRGVLSCTSLPGTPACIAAVAPDGCQVVAGCDDGVIRVFSVAGDDALLQSEPLPARHRGAITALAFAPNGLLLASVDANRELVVWDRATREPRLKAVFHTARILCLAWRPDSARVASGGLDCCIIVWNPDEPASKRVTIPQAHREGVTALGWSNTTLLSAGADCTLRTWSLP